MTLAGTEAAAILVMLMEEVLDARIASGRNSLANEPNSCCFKLQFSVAACGERCQEDEQLVFQIL